MGARTFRSATDADLDRLVEIHMSSYPDDRNAAVRARNFTHNPLGNVADLIVCIEEQRIVGHGFLFPLRVWLRGKSVSLGGIASLGVAPEARKTGVARDLLLHMHHASEARGDLLTLLYPFRQAFYAPFGYAPVTPSERLIFSPRAVPWKSDVRAAGDAEALWTDVARRSNGMLDRPRALWDRKKSDERRTMLFCDGGYIAWELLQTEPHAETRLVVHEMVATTPDAMRALIGAIGAQRDQAHSAEIEVPRGHVLSHALVDPDRMRFGTEIVEHTIGALVGGPMLRLASIERALEFVPRDVGCIVDGARVRDGKRTLATDRATLGALIFGGVRISEAIALGLASGDAPDEMLAHPPYFSPDPF